MVAAAEGVDSLPAPGFGDLVVGFGNEVAAAGYCSQLVRTRSAGYCSQLVGCRTQAAPDLHNLVAAAAAAGCCSRVVDSVGQRNQTGIGFDNQLFVVFVDWIEQKAYGSLAGSVGRLDDDHQH